MRFPILPKIVLNVATLAMIMVASDVSAQQYARNSNLPRPYPSGNVHRLIPGDAPPGMIGTARLQGRGPVGGHYQAVAFRGPGSTEFSLPISGVFQPPTGRPPLCAGLLIGSVYRFKITSIPGYEGEELFPTIEVIDRTYPPESLAARFPIPINLELEDLQDALEGRLVTRVIYLEDPSTAVPLAETPESSRTIDIPGNEDVLGVADQLGKPIAIVRIGSLAPPTYEPLLPEFFLGYPHWLPAAIQPAVETSGDQSPITPGDIVPDDMNGGVTHSFSDRDPI